VTAKEAQSFRPRQRMQGREALQEPGELGPEVSRFGLMVGLGPSRLFFWLNQPRVLCSQRQQSQQTNNARERIRKIQPPVPVPPCACACSHKGKRNRSIHDAATPVALASLVVQAEASTYVQTAAAVPRAPRASRDVPEQTQGEAAATPWSPGRGAAPDRARPRAPYAAASRSIRAGKPAGGAVSDDLFQSCRSRFCWRRHGWRPNPARVLSPSAWTQLAGFPFPAQNSCPLRTPTFQPISAKGLLLMDTNYPFLLACLVVVSVQLQTMTEHYLDL
jgi:hypothetical protein